MHPRLSFLLLFSAIGVLMQGCDSQHQKGDVAGKITFGGKPLKVPGRLEIAFEDSKGGMMTAVIEEDGTYVANGLAPGEVRVFFVYVSQAAINQGKSGVRKLMKPNTKAQDAREGVDISNPVAEKYREARTSDLKFQIEAPKTNVFDYDLPEPAQR